MSDVIVLGSNAIVEQPDSGALQKAESDVRTVVYKGELSLILAEQPAKGTEYESGWVVLTSDVKPMRGGLAVLTITLAPMSQDEALNPLPLSTKWEVVWQQLEKPILTHPLFSSVVDEVAAWSETPDRAKTVDTLSDAIAQAAAARILKGVESYLMFSPVITKTQTYSAMPVTGKCGVPGNPPGAPSIPDGYEYLKTADGAVQQDDGSYVRTEQWTGADEWDAVLYPPATA